MKKLLALLYLFAAQLQAQNYFLYVAAESDDTVSLLKFDGDNISELERFDVGYYPTEIEGPHGITVGPNGDYWYLSLAHGNPFGKLIKYSTKDNKVVGETSLGLFPATMQISSVTGLLYCVNFNLHGKMNPSTVSVVDPETMTEIKKITTGAMPHGSRMSPDGLKQYSVSMMSSELYEIDALDLSVSRKMDLENNMSDKKMMTKKISMNHSMDNKKMMNSSKGMNHPNNENEKEHPMEMKNGMHMSDVKPTWVIHHPTKKTLYVAGNGSNEIIEIDSEKWKISKRIKTQKGPYNVEVSPNGKYLVATLKGEGSTAVWDLENNYKTNIIKNSTTVSHGIAISNDSKYAFVSVEGVGGEPGIVDVINLDDPKLISSVEVGKQAGGIAFWKTD